MSGTFTVGGTVTYTVILTNNGTDGQADNPGQRVHRHPARGPHPGERDSDERHGGRHHRPNTVTWNGSLAPLGGTVTITITATINAGHRRA